MNKNEKKAVAIKLDSESMKKVVGGASLAGTPVHVSQQATAIGRVWAVL